MSQGTRTLPKVMDTFIIVIIAVILCTLFKHCDITQNTPNTCFHFIFQLSIKKAKFNRIIIDILACVAAEANSLGLLARKYLSLHAGKWWSYLCFFMKNMMMLERDRTHKVETWTHTTFCLQDRRPKFLQMEPWNQRTVSFALALKSPCHISLSLLIHRVKYSV